MNMVSHNARKGDRMKKREFETVRIASEIRKNVWDEVKRLAYWQRRTITATVEIALLEHLAKYGPQKPIPDDDDGPRVASFRD